MRAQRMIKLLMWLAAFRSALFVLPVFMPYYHNQLGLGFADFLFAESIFALTIVLCEIPSGWLSDIWSRKRVLVVSILFEIAGFSLLFIADTLLLAALAQAIIGIGCSLYSGTDSALFYEYLAEQKQEDRYRALYSRNFAISFYVLTVSSVVSGFLYTLNPYLPLALTIAGFAMALVVGLFLHEPARSKQGVQGNPFADMAASIRFALRERPEIGSMILYGSLLCGVSKVLFWSYQPFFTLVEVPVALFGVLAAVGSLLSGLAGQFGHRLDRIAAPRYVLYALGWLCMIGAFVSALFPSVWTLPLLFTASLAFGFYKPAMDDFLNKRVGAERRATLLSANSLGVSLVFVPLSLIGGQLDQKGGVAYVLFFLAGFLLLTKLLYACLPHVKRKVSMFFTAI